MKFSEILGLNYKETVLISQNQQAKPETMGFRLSKNQERIWFLDKLAQNKALYHNPSVIQIQGLLDVSRFESACFSLIQKHDQLRVVIREVEDKPLQFILSCNCFSFLQIDLTNTIERLDTVIQEIVNTPFNFQNGPLCKFILIKLKKNLNVFVLNLHHIISDGWSKSILLKDLLSSYLEYSQFSSLSYSTSNYTYQHFVTEQHSKITNESWKEFFPKKIEPLELITNREYPDIPLGQGSIFSFQFSELFSSQISSFIRDQGITLFTFFLSIYAITLFRCTGQLEFAIGSPVSGRTKKEWEDIVGLFVNTVVFPIQIKPNLSYLEYLALFKAQIFKILSYQDTPFEDIVKALNPPRDIKRNPLFQVMLQYDNFSLPPISTKDLIFFPQPIDFNIAQVDLSMTLWKNKETICGSLEYRTDIFDKSSIQGFYTYFSSIAEHVILDAKEKIKKLKLISSDEEQRLKNFNDTKTTLPYYNFLPRIEKIAQSYPEQIAIITPQSSIKYEDLLRQLRQLAHCLIGKGLGNNSKIAIILPASVELIVALLAASTIGSIFSIIDPHYPLFRQQQLLDLFDPDFVIDSNSSNLKKNAHFNNIKEILLESVKYDPTEIKDTVYEHDSLCVVFTSGTMGVPKGVILGHYALANLVNSFINSYNVSFEDKVLSLSSVSFASFLGEVLPCLCAGATFVISDIPTILDYSKFFSLIELEKISILSTVPSFIRYLNSLGTQPSCLRLLLSGGEALFERDICNFKAPLKIVNSYGLTEGTICSSYELIDPSNISQDVGITLGSPISNTELFILDDFGNIAPLGYPGEIGIGGIGIMKGYLNDAKSTQETLIKHPFNDDEQVLLTKDIGIQLPSGHIRYIGRKDLQTKIRGYRVNLLEIEKKILEANFVINAAVKTVVKENKSQLVAVVEAKNQYPLLATELRNWLTNYLPEYMIPTDILVVDRMPLNQHGKIDWVMLDQQISVIQKNKAPLISLMLSSIEKEIFQIWSRVLNRTDIEIDQNFFDLGGHSILLMEVHHALKQVFTKKIEVTDLFKFPTIRSLAEYLQDNSISLENDSHIQDRIKMQKLASQQYRKKFAIMASPIAKKNHIENDA